MEMPKKSIFANPIQTFNGTPVKLVQTGSKRFFCGTNYLFYELELISHVLGPEKALFLYQFSDVFNVTGNITFQNLNCATKLRNAQMSVTMV